MQHGGRCNYLAEIWQAISPIGETKHDFLELALLGSQWCFHLSDRSTECKIHAKFIVFPYWHAEAIESFMQLSSLFCALSNAI